MLVYFQLITTQEDKTKFTQLYDTYRNVMFSVAYRILQNPQDAEDAVHQAFVSILQNLNKIKAVDAPATKAYVMIIAERKAIDMLRMNSRCVSSDEIETMPGIDIPLPGDHGLADAMAQLPAKSRQLLLLRFDQEERVGLEADLLSPMAPAPDRYTSMWVRLLLGRLCLKCAAAHGGWLHHRADAEALLRSSAPVA